MHYLFAPSVFDFAFSCFLCKYFSNFGPFGPTSPKVYSSADWGLELSNQRLISQIDMPDRRTSLFVVATQYGNEEESAC